jgi:hypothetical protein
MKEEMRKGIKYLHQILSWSSIAMGNCIKECNVCEPGTCESKAHKENIKKLLS